MLCRNALWDCLGEGVAISIGCQRGHWNRCLVQNNVHYFHINLTTPCLPPKICISTVSKFSWEDCNPKRNWKQCLCKTFGAKQGVFWECESSELESFRIEDEEEYEYEIQLKLFVRVLKKRHQASFILLFFSTKKVSTVIYTEWGYVLSRWQNDKTSYI